MADSKLLKEAIADAKAVRETAIENARIALEEAFTPKLQSLVTKKLQSEMEDEEEDWDEEDVEDVEENVNSSGIGKGDGKAESGTDNKQPSGNTANTELDPETQNQSAAVGAEDPENEKVDDLKEDESSHELPDPYDAEYETPEEEGETGVYEEEEYDDEDDEFDEDELDLESIIRELESEIEDEEDEGEVEVEPEAEPVSEDEDGDGEVDVDIEDDEVEIELPDDEDEDFDDEIDLDEILREMGYGDDDELDENEDGVEVDTDRVEDLEGELDEAYSTIKELKGTINEVNLLNAKLLYTNKLFRSYELDNSQKVKVVESLDRTSNVREVKLVYSTLAESLRFGGKVGSKKVKKITEGLASRPSKSTAPKKEIISEGNEMADRFKKLAGINKTK